MGVGVSDGSGSAAMVAATGSGSVVPDASTGSVKGDVSVPGESTVKSTGDSIAASLGT
jgi:hypothetical protein